MTYYDQIKDLNPQEIREFVKDNDENESFLNEILESRDLIIPLLGKSKAISPKISEAFLTNPEDADFISLALIESNFTPSSSFIEKIVNLEFIQESTLESLFNSFSSIIPNTELILVLINKGFIELASQIILKHNKFQNYTILLNLIKSNQDLNLEIIDLISNSEECQIFVLSQLETVSPSVYDPVLINNIIEKQSEISLEVAMAVAKINLSKNSLEKVFYAIIDSKSAKNASSFYASKSINNIEMKYSPLIEDFYHSSEFQPILEENIVFLDCPKDSPLRFYSINKNPKLADREELIELSNNRKSSGSLISHCLTKDLDLIKKMNVDILCSKLSPSDVYDQLIFGTHYEDKVIYLLEVLPSKYSPKLRSLVSVEKANKAKGKIKQSYFPELLKAIVDDNLIDFRQSLSYGYSLQKFAQDTAQSSKIESCFKVRLKESIFCDLSKEEILILAKSQIRFPSSYDESNFPHSYQFDSLESQILARKMNFRLAYNLCNDKINFIKSIKDEDNYEVSSIFSDFFDEIMLDEPLFRAFLSKPKKGKIDLSKKEIIMKITSIFDKKEFHKFFQIESYSVSSYLNLKDKDGQFIYDESEVLDYIKKDPRTLEEKSFLNSIMDRDVEFLKKINKAYMIGNKGLQEIFGKDFKISRKSIPLHKDLETFLESDTEQFCLDLFEKEKYDIRSISNKLINPNLIGTYGKGKTFYVSVADTSQLEDYIEKYKDIKIAVEKLEIKLYLSDVGVPELKILNILSENLTVSSISIDLNIEYSSMKKRDQSISQFQSKITELQKVMDMFNVKEIIVENDSMDFEFKMLLLRNNINFEGRSEFINNIYTVLEERPRKFDLAFAEDYPNYGLIYDKNLIQIILTENKDKDILDWARSRIGDLSSVMFNEHELRFLDPVQIKTIMDSGMTILTNEDYLMWENKNQILINPTDFEAIDIEDHSLREKAELIRFIENEADPNYKKLNLLSSNLDLLDKLLPYKDMMAISQYSSEEISSILSISKKIQDNPKIMNGIKDLLALKGMPFLLKVINYKKVVELSKNEIEFDLSDFLNYSNQNKVIENEGFDQIPSNSISSFLNESKSVFRYILKNKDKKFISRFFRSFSGQSDSYAEDIVDMIISIDKGFENLKSKANIEKDILSDIEQEELSNSIKGIEDRLIEVSLMDHAVHMHDRLVTLASFIENDPLQILGQHKFLPLEKNKEIASELGFQVYFPKNRGEVQSIGSLHGWCVSNNSSYCDKVISENNILVALTKLGSDNSLNDIVALAHFKNSNKGYYIEQLKWSELIKGERNVDGLQDFNHKKLLNVINSHLSTINENKE